MDIRTNIKNILNKKIKEDKVIQQKELAMKCNISPSAITKWLNGERVPDIESIPTVCKALGITFDEFFGIDSIEVISSEDKLLLNKIADNPVLKDIIINYKKD